MKKRTAISQRSVHALQQLVRRLLQRSRAPRYPRVCEGTLPSGRPYRFVINGPLRPDEADDDEFVAPATVGPDPDDDPAIETERPKLLPPLAVQLAALRQHTLEQAGLVDDEDEEQERDRKLLWWFRRQRDQAD